MATQAQIDLVKENLPSWREEITPDWDDDHISEMLDLHSYNVSKVVRQYWLQRVNDTAGLTDVADVGASRPLSQLYQHAQEMLRYWDKVAGVAGLGSSNGKIKKRYDRRFSPPYGLSPYGGVYVRTD